MCVRCRGRGRGKVVIVLIVMRREEIHFIDEGSVVVVVVIMIRGWRRGMAVVGTAKVDLEGYGGAVGSIG